MKKTNKKLTTKFLDLGLEKLKSSGLTSEDAKELGMESLAANQTTGLHPMFRPLSCLKLNYYGVDGKPISDWPKAKPFYRIRYLEEGTDFKSVSDKKPLRYSQEPNTAPVAYYPKNQNWLELISDPNQPLIITEGELKAAKACKEGFPSIGLGGVHNWRSAKYGISWLPSLDLPDWRRRNVYIVFDSDYKTNQNVCIALRQIAEELHDRGSFVHIVCLPQLDTLDKVGLDDYLTLAGPTANNMFTQLLSEAEPLGLTKPLWLLNTKYIYVQDPGFIIDQKTKTKTAPGAFKEHLQAPLSYQEKNIRLDGTISYKSVSAAGAWLKWPLRTEVAKLTYAPGKTQFIYGDNSQFNIWPGWGVEPVKGNHKPFLDLVNHILTGAGEDAKKWFLSWCAYPLKNPGTKLFSSVALHGIKHGTGKSLIGYTLGRIYGQNFTEISQLDLHNGFNEWAEGKQLVMGDDVTGSNKRQDADYLKKLITQREIRINAKYLPSYVVPDCINYFFTANGPDSFFLEDDDRRFFVSEVVVPPLSEKFYIDYGAWLDGGGASAIFKYLLDYDIGKFNPAAPAFRTSAKERMIANVQSDLGGWVRQLVSNPDHLLMVGAIKIEKDLFTSKELLNLYDPSSRTGTTANGLGRELARAGIRQVCDGKPLRLADGSQARYYAIRNTDRWISCTKHTLISDHLNKWLKKSGVPQTKF